MSGRPPFQAGASALCAMGEGGILRALWKMAEASRVGLRADLRKIPVRQETIEICERFDLNPYKLLSQERSSLESAAGSRWCRNIGDLGFLRL